MALDLTRRELEGALAGLGAICRQDTTLLLGGSAALILTNALERGTNDGDVIASHPDLGTLQPLFVPWPRTADYPTVG